MAEHKNLQLKYYNDTAISYDEMHLSTEGEHDFALAMFSAYIEYYNIKTVLDVGAGSGRVATYLRDKFPDLKVISLEPAKELRNIMLSKGLPRESILSGDVCSLNFSDEEFDAVCEFGVLHHVKNPSVAVGEMLRVAKKGVFLSDCNNFAQGSLIIRTIKQILHQLKLWKLADYLKTKGRGYTITEGDGLAYSFSVFDSLKLMKKNCQTVHVLNNTGSGPNLYRSSDHLSIYGVKSR